VQVQRCIGGTEVVRCRVLGAAEGASAQLNWQVIVQVWRFCRGEDAEVQRRSAEVKGEKLVQSSAEHVRVAQQVARFSTAE
jgi:hypothetical protein